MRTWRQGLPSGWVSRTFTIDTAQPDDGAILYEHADYGGRWVAFTGDDPTLVNDEFNDRASSLRVLGDYAVTLCQDVNHGGTCTTFVSDDPDLSDDPIGDDRASSVRVEPGECYVAEGVVLYAGANYGGSCLPFTGDDADLSNESFEDDASSLRVIGDLQATLYRNVAYGGASSTFAADDPNLADDAVGNDTASSLKVEPQAPPGQWQADYWSNTDFTGDHFAATVPGPYLFRDWGDGSPGDGFDPDTWSARFTRSASFRGGTYVFHFDHDDGGRLYVDGVQVIDRWNGCAGTNYTATLSAGTHQLRVDFRDFTVLARLELWWRGLGVLPHNRPDPDR